MKKEIDTAGAVLPGAGHHLCSQLAYRPQVVEVFPGQGRCKRFSDQRSDPFLTRSIGVVHDLAQRASELEIAGLPCQPYAATILAQTDKAAFDEKAIRRNPPTRLPSLDAEQSHGSGGTVKLMQNLVSELFEIVVALIAQSRRSILVSMSSKPNSSRAKRTFISKPSSFDGTAVYSRRMRRNSCRRRFRFLASNEALSSNSRSSMSPSRASSACRAAAT